MKPCNWFGRAVGLRVVRTSRVRTRCEQGVEGTRQSPPSLEATRRFPPRADNFTLHETTAPIYQHPQQDGDIALLRQVFPFGLRKHDSPLSTWYLANDEPMRGVRCGRGRTPRMGQKPHIAPHMRMLGASEPPAWRWAIRV